MGIRAGRVGCTNLGKPLLQFRWAAGAGLTSVPERLLRQALLSRWSAGDRSSIKDCDPQIFPEACEPLYSDGRWQGRAGKGAVVVAEREL